MKSSTLVIGAGIMALTLLAGCGGTTTTSPSSNALQSLLGGLGSTPGGTPGSGGSSGSVSACTAMSQSVAANLTGDSGITSLAGAGAASVAGFGTCVYADLTNSTGGSNGAAIVIEPVPGAVSAQVLQAALAAQAKNGTSNYQAVSGIGDAAYADTKANEGDLVFAKGNTLVVIVVSSSTKSGTDILSGVQTFAMQIAGQL